MTLINLLALLSGDCKMREKEGRSPDPWARCGAFFCDLNGPKPPDLPPGARPRLRLAVSNRGDAA